MPDSVSAVSYFSVVVPNKTGEGAKALEALKAAGVNLLGFWGYPIKGKKSVLDIAPEDAKTFPKAAKKLGLTPGEKKSAFLVTGEDRPGAVAETLSKLANAGISVHAAQAICAGANRYGALIQVADESYKKAKKILGAS